jgi:hypothetical protein
MRAANTGCSFRKLSTATTSFSVVAPRWIISANVCSTPIEPSASRTRSPSSSVARSQALPGQVANRDRGHEPAQSRDPQPLRKRLYQAIRPRSPHLRTEAASNNVNDYGVKKAVENLPVLQSALSAINDNYLSVQQDILETFVDSQPFDAGAVRKYRSRKKRAAEWEVAVERPTYDLTIFKLHCGGLTLKIYSKGERVLRIDHP